MKGHIKQRSKGSWSIVLDLGKGPDGKRKQKWHTVQGTKKDAEKELNKLVHSFNIGTYVEPHKQTVGEYLEQWLRDYAQSSVAPLTFTRYTVIVRRHLIPALGNLHLVKLMPMHIQSYYSQALQSGRYDGQGGLSAKTVLQHHRVLREALHHGVKWQLLIRNPADAVEPPRVQRKEMRVLSDQEVNQVLEGAAGSWFYLPCLFAASTGLRQDEVLSLRWQDIDMGAGKLSVTKSKTAKGRRVVVLPETVMETLRKHKVSQARERLQMGAAYQNSGLVCAWPDGTKYLGSSVTHAFKKLLKKLGIVDAPFHALRHSHATMLLRQGIHPKVVSERLGHASIGITLDLYSHVLPDLQEEAAQKVDQVLRSGLQDKQAAIRY